MNTADTVTCVLCWHSFKEDDTMSLACEIMGSVCDDCAADHARTCRECGE